MWSQQLFIAELFLLMHHPCIVRCSFTRLGVIQWLKCIIFGHVDSFIICLGIGQALQLPCASVNCQVAAKECQNIVFDPPPHTHVRHQHAVVMVHARCWLSGKQHIHPQQVSLLEYDVIKLPNSSEEKSETLMSNIARFRNSPDIITSLDLFMQHWEYLIYVQEYRPTVFFPFLKDLCNINPCK